FVNTSGRLLGKPLLKRNCDCFAARFEPAPLEPGAVGKLLVTTDIQALGAKRASVGIFWPQDVRASVMWRIRVPRIRGLVILPRRLDAAIWNERRSAVLHYIADFDAGPRPDSAALVAGPLVEPPAAFAVEP